MNVNGTTWTARKPGWQPPQRLLDLLAWLHPRIRLVYSGSVRRWALLQYCDGRWEWVAPIEGLPTVQNTLGRLAKLRLRTLDDIERLEEELDRRDDPLDEAARAAAEERIDEGHDRMWHALGTSTSVAVNGSS